MDKTLHFNFFFFIVSKRYIAKMANFKMNRFYYRPLPDNLTIGQSDIDGYGIFAIFFLTYYYLNQSYLNCLNC